MQRVLLSKVASDLISLIVTGSNINVINLNIVNIHFTSISFSTNCYYMMLDNVESVIYSKSILPTQAVSIILFEKSRNASNWNYFMGNQL